MAKDVDTTPTFAIVMKVPNDGVGTRAAKALLPGGVGALTGVAAGVWLKHMYDGRKPGGKSTNEPAQAPVQNVGVANNEIHLCPPVQEVCTLANDDMHLDHMIKSLADLSVNNEGNALGGYLALQALKAYILQQQGKCKTFTFQLSDFNLRHTAANVRNSITEDFPNSVRLYISSLEDKRYASAFKGESPKSARARQEPPSFDAELQSLRASVERLERDLVQKELHEKRLTEGWASERSRLGAQLKSIDQTLAE
jgi:hypothetical protein